MSKEQDSIFVRNSGILLCVLVSFAIIVMIIAKTVHHGFMESQVTETMLAQRLSPVGKVNISREPITLAATEPAPLVQKDAPEVQPQPEAQQNSGKQAYDKICFACHAQGIAGAPKMGDAAAWDGRLGKGLEALVKSAIAGFQGQTGMMPPRGGLATLSDEEVKAAVMYLVEAVGGAGEPEPATAQAATPQAEESQAAAQPVADTDSDTAARGKEVYDKACFICHATGAAGAPKLGDTPAWADRIATGAETLHNHAINGFMGKVGLMPPKGGRPDIPDDDVKAAVDYMVGASQ